VIPLLLHYIAHTGSRELFRLAVLSVALGVAFAASNLFGVSFALGAFFAGMTLSESQLSQVAAEETLPLRDAFAVLFFVSVGMLFDPLISFTDPWPIVGALLLVLVGNPCAAYLTARLFGSGWHSALLAAAGLAQIGEFSFILVDLAIDLGILSERGRHLILATSILSILVNPIVMAMADRLVRRRDRRVPDKAEEPAITREDVNPTSLTDHAVLVGYGRVGRVVGEGLMQRGWPLLVIEDAANALEALKGKPVEIIHGNAADSQVLGATNLGKARALLVAIPNAFEAGQIVAQARAANATLKIIARAHFDAEIEHLRGLGADTIIMGEREIAHAMVEHVTNGGTRAAAAAPSV
jgi:CPA2 family monovalent cation:H+ antiporter-2